MNVRLKINGKNEDRVFSLSSSPTEDKFLRFTMKLNGVFTHYVFEKLQVGDKMGLLLPVGKFNIEINSNISRNYLMIAGGSGITPIYSMIKTLVSREPGSKITLFYANKSESTKIFNRELTNLEKQFANLNIVDFFSIENHRLQKKDIEEFIQQNPDAECYICGSENLRKAVKSYLKEAGVRSQNIHYEDYVDSYVKTILGLYLV